MAKKGEGKHMKRIAKPKAIPITDKKAFTWIKRTGCGPHPIRSAIPLIVLLRDVLRVAKNGREARAILVQRMAEIDGKPRTEEGFPVGLMDVVGFPKAGKYYRMVVDWKSRLQPIEIKKEEAAKKLLRVVNKHVAPGARTSLTFHDGRNMLGNDSHIRCGDSILVSLPDAKMVEHLKLEPGSRCLVREGKHAGTVVTLNEIIQRKAGKPAEARVTDEKGKEEFVTVARYLFVVNSGFRVSE